MKFDKKYALSEVETEEAEKELAFSDRYNGPVTFVGETGLYGYRQGNKVVLPPQFSEAFSFCNGYAIAARNGFWGILKLVDGSFQCKVTRGSSNGNEMTMDYALTVPNGWKGDPLLLYDMTDEEKKAYTSQTNNESLYDFSVTLPKGNRKVCIGNGNLLVWSNEQLKDTGMGSSSSSSVSGGEVFSVHFSSNSIKANAKDIAAMNVMIRNNSQETKSVAVKITGDRLGTIEKTLTLKAGEQGLIPVSFHKIAFKEKRSINVNVSGMANVISKKIEVNPFYEDF